MKKLWINLFRRKNAGDENELNNRLKALYQYSSSEFGQQINATNAVLIQIREVLVLYSVYKKLSAVEIEQWRKEIIEHQTFDLRYMRLIEYLIECLYGGFKRLINKDTVVLSEIYNDLCMLIVLLVKADRIIDVSDFLNAAVNILEGPCN